jgi:hypothetical protein
VAPCSARFDIHEIALAQGYVGGRPPDATINLYLLSLIRCNIFIWKKSNSGRFLWRCFAAEDGQRNENHDGSEFHGT